MSERCGGERGLDELAAEIRTCAAGLAAATGRWLGMVAEFDRRDGWAGQGVKSCAHWLSWTCGLSANAAREHVRVAHALAGLPLLATAFCAGRLSYSVVRALTRIAGPDNEADLLEVGRSGTVAHVERIVRGWRRADRCTDPEPSPDSGRLGLRLHWDEDGSLRVSGRLSAEDGALLQTALSAAADRLESQRPAPSAEDVVAAKEWAAGGPGPHTPRRPIGAGECLGEVARGYLDPAPAKQSAAARHQVVVHVDADVLASDTAAGAAYLEGGPALSAEQVARISCDASLVVMLRRGTEVLDVGRSTRSIPAALNRALWARDGGCRFPGCQERRRSRVQAHHVRFWSRGGRTSLANLVLLCRWHHRLIHHDGFTITVEPGGMVRFGEPAGAVLPDQPLPLTAHDGALPDAAEGLMPLWSGERLDLDYAVSVLVGDHRRRRRQRRNEAQPTAA